MVERRVRGQDWFEPVAPPPTLSKVLACSWTARPSGVHRLTPDACVDIVVLDSGRVVLCGPEQQSWTFELPPGTTSVGVRFRPGLAGVALDADLYEIGDSVVPLADLIGDVGTVLGRDLAAIRSLDQRRRALEAWCVERWAGVVPDPVAEAILAWAGSVPHRTLDDLEGRVGLSARSLRRRSRRRFGYPPSTLARIVRFQRFCGAADRAGTLGDDGASRSLAALSALAGYADQAHLARDCRAITSLTPRAFLAEYFPTFPDMSDPFKIGPLPSTTMTS